MEETSTWNVGTLVWLAFGLLLVHALVANLVELVVDAVADRRARRRPATSAGDDHGFFDGDDDLLGGDDGFSWADAYSIRYGEPPEEPEPIGACPRCGSPVLPVVYGFPGPALVQAAEDGRVLLGGCTIREQRAACARCTAPF